MNDVKFDLNDIVLIPSIQSQIASRKECWPQTCDDFFNLCGFLPIMAAPMDTVVSNENVQTYIDNKIIPCVPRGIKTSVHLDNLVFKSFGLCDIEQQMQHYTFNKGDISIPFFFYAYPNVLIDIANGHMAKLAKLVFWIKTTFPKIKLMVGNVANPETYKLLSMAGADYIRCSIGTGAGCTTAANVSINYPMGSLISECRALKEEFNLKANIVADGGMRNYSDIIKALALGADYVMVGSLFNKALESAGFNYFFGQRINIKIAKVFWSWNLSIKKKYRGMSTKAVQRRWGKTNLVTAEGITKYQKVEYTLSQWTENFKDYLKSAMSYCNAKTLDEFIGKAKYVFITQNAFKRFDK